jgi:hypothetical protein
MTCRQGIIYIIQECSFLLVLFVLVSGFMPRMLTASSNELEASGVLLLYVSTSSMLLCWLVQLDMQWLN